MSQQLIAKQKSISAATIEEGEFISYPTILEVYAQHRLNQFMKEGVRHLIAVLAEKYPNKFKRIFDNFEEFYLTFDCCIQFLFLKSQHATFSETFYKIRRVRVDGLKELTNGNIFSTLLCNSIFPYLYSRLMRWENNQTALPSPAQQVSRQVFSICDALFTVASVVQKIRYASNQTKTYDLWMTICRMQAVHAQQQRQSFLLWGTMTAEFTFTFGSMILRLASIWYSKERLMDQAPIPPPPSKENVENVDKCALCSQPFERPAVLASSGYVFCYECIKNYVDQHRKCPITGYITHSQLIVPLNLN